MNYLTGLGFLGSNLIKKAPSTVAIPHEKILSTEYKPFDNFYFFSAFGNMAHHEGSTKIIRANVIDPAYTIEKVKKMKFNSFVFMSTSSVKLSHQTMYSRTKRATEEILLAYMEKYDLPICIIRPFSIIGVGEQEEHLIPKLIDSCYTGKLMNFVPEPTHDYIDVEDVVEGILNLSENKARGIFELGNGVSYSNQEVLDIVETVTGKEANVNIVKSLRDYDSENWVSTNFRSRGYGWMPKKTLTDTISEMVKEYERTNVIQPSRRGK